MGTPTCAEGPPPVADARRRAWTWAPLLAVLASLGGAGPAHATFHEIKVREAFPGSNDDSYVELQMYAPGQTSLATHALTVYESNGELEHTSTFPSGISNGANQATVLIGDTNVQASFGVAPDLVDSGLNLSNAGGAACWIAGTAVNADCVAWGSFSSPSPAFESATATSAGMPVSQGGIVAGKAIRRRIAPGCPTLLEAGDDSNDSATDFAEVNPAPRDNASAITETACTTPTVAIDSKPANPTKSTTATFAYHSTPTGASIECKLDAEAFAGCEASGISYPGLSDGPHTFQVRAHNAGGTGAATSYTWTVDTQPPTATLKTHPNNPSPGGSAAFSYESNELNSTFECSLVEEGEPDSFSSCPPTGKTYTSLADGMYAFKVRATDKAGNQGSPVSFDWEVDNSLADTIPPHCHRRPTVGGGVRPSRLVLGKATG